MQQLALLQSSTANLPALIEEASAILAGASTAAEVLQAIDMAAIIYDIAERAALRARLQGAFDEVVSRARRAQGGAAEIEIEAKRLLALRYGEAQARGEVAKHSPGNPQIVPAGNDLPATAAEVGITRKLVHQGRQINKAETADPGVVKRVIGKILDAGEAPSQSRIQAEVKKAIPPKPEVGRTHTAISLEQWKVLGTQERKDALASFNKDARFLKQTTAGIEWAQWSWNPVTGCEHTCPYCYARDIAQRYPDAFPFAFDPALNPERLSAPSRTKVPAEAATDARFKNVFTCSMADLFGRWVPREWIETVLNQARANPQWNFLFLTKFPKRMAEFDIPPNAWMGTTVDLQKRVNAAEEAFAIIAEKQPKALRWLSIEPLIEPLRFQRLDLFEWIVIGGASPSSKTEEWKPPFKVIADLVEQADRVGAQIYFKTNLLGNRIINLPRGMPVKRDPQKAPEVFHYLSRREVQEAAT